VQESAEEAAVKVDRQYSEPLSLSLSLKNPGISPKLPRNKPGIIPLGRSRQRRRR